jgi:hypothetical protein
MDIFKHLSSTYKVDYWCLADEANPHSRLQKCTCPPNMTISSLRRFICIRGVVHVELGQRLNRLIPRFLLQMILKVKYPAASFALLSRMSSLYSNSSKIDISRVFSELPNPLELELFELLVQFEDFVSVGANYIFMGSLFDESPLPSFLIVHDVQSRNVDEQIHLRVGELKSLSNPSMVFFINHQDMEYVRNLGWEGEGGLIGISNQIAHLEATPRTNFRPLIVFTGSKASENLESLKILIEQVYLPARKNLPDLELHIWGGVSELAERFRGISGIIVHGLYKDGFNIYSNAKYAVIFHSIVGGIKIKLIESMINGVVPIVDRNTADGLSGSLLQHIEVVDSPRDAVRILSTFENDFEVYLARRSAVREYCRVNMSQVNAYYPLNLWLKEVGGLD